ncbi:AMP-binding enzyme [Neofusicoccum parvum]|uniref:AMP-binding enzyme n=1 Tax=Neofusicoccum parvum TaxID=310453 RepID=A0ACB5SBC0_9PEZI|nr:AMP-binding enzyme [Neofusicoccum parvum]
MKPRMDNPALISRFNGWHMELEQLDSAYGSYIDKMPHIDEIVNSANQVVANSGPRTIAFTLEEATSRSSDIDEFNFILVHRFIRDDELTRLRERETISPAEPGLEKGDVVTYPILVNGIVAFGGIFAGINPAYTQYEIAHAIKAAKIKCFITEPDLVKNVLPAARDAGIPESRIFIFDKPSQTVPAGMQSWTTLLSYGEQDWVRFDDLETVKTTEAARLFSSGMTGLPKAARLSHHNFIAQHHVTEPQTFLPFKPGILVAIPLFHAGAAPRTHFSPLRSGTQTYIMRRFDAAAFLANVERHRITVLVGVPAMMRALLDQRPSPHALRSVRAASSGAAPLHRDVRARVKALLGPAVPYTQAWGMTETACRATGFAWPDEDADDADDAACSVGYAVPGLDLKLTDEAGREVAACDDDDARGELWVRGPIVFMGYVDSPAANAAWDADGFFPTGDVAYCSGRNGQWYIVDRKKELIKVRGFQVAPPELEGVLLTHPLVADVAVVGVKATPDGSELPRAYVVRRPGAEGDALMVQDVKKYVAERLSSYKRLEGGVVFVDELPKNPTMKVMKNVLRERAAKEMGTKL